LLTVSQLPPPSCEICFAHVSRELMHFHRDWHAAQTGGGQRFFEKSHAETELDELSRLVASLRSLPALAASPEFVSKLRDHLTTEVFAMAIEAHELDDSDPAG
jgi:hypothetical protein